MPDGRLLVLSAHDNRVHRREPDGELVVHADLSAMAPGPLNDMITDPAGARTSATTASTARPARATPPISRLYAPRGVPQTAVICLDADSSVLSLSEPLTFPNGCCFLDARRTFVVAETLAFRLTALTVLCRTDGFPVRRQWASLIQPWLWRALNAPGVVGTMTRRVSTVMDRPRIAQRSGSPIVPDDIADAGDDTMWVASALRRETVRSQSGTVLERIRTSQHTLSCVVGCRDKRSLFVATIPTLDAEKSGRRNGGRIECLQLTEESN